MRTVVQMGQSRVVYKNNKKYEDDYRQFKYDNKKHINEYLHYVDGRLVERKPWKINRSMNMFSVSKKKKKRNKNKKGTKNKTKKPKKKSKRSSMNSKRKKRTKRTKRTKKTKK